MAGNCSTSPPFGGLPNRLGAGPVGYDGNLLMGESVPATIAIEDQLVGFFGRVIQKGERADFRSLIPLSESYRCSVHGWAALFCAPAPAAPVVRSSRAHPANGVSAWPSTYFCSSLTPLSRCPAWR